MRTYPSQLVRKRISDGSKSMVLILLGGLALGACSLQQNPLAEFPEVIQDAKPPMTKPDIPLALPSDALRIEGVDFFTFQEGVENSFELKTRVLIKDYEVREFEVLNLSEFPGASWDPTSGKFTWKPESGSVAGGWVTQKILRVRMVASSPLEKNPPLLSEKQIQIFVQKVSRAPVIQSLELKAKDLREGSTYDFEIRLIDEDAGLDSTQVSDVAFLAPANTFPKVKNLAPFVTFRTIDPVRGSPGHWLVRYRLNLKGEEITDSSTDAGFDVVALGRWGQRSQVLPFRTKVFTQLPDPVSNMSTNALTFPVGIESLYEFIVWDPKGEGRLSLLRVEQNPTGSQVQCVTGALRSILHCFFKWTPEEAQKGKLFTVRVVIESRNSDGSDPSKLERNLNLRVKADEKVSRIVEVPDTERSSPDSSEDQEPNPAEELPF